MMIIGYYCLVIGIPMALIGSVLVLRGDKEHSMMIIGYYCLVIGIPMALIGSVLVLIGIGLNMC
jgi:hypothetical protein